MDATRERSFVAAALILSLIPALLFLGSFDELLWLEVLLATASIAVTAIIARRIWLERDGEQRSYALFFALLLTFWLLTWFWYADDFCDGYWMFVLVNAIECALLCTAIYLLGRWRANLRRYAFCFYAGLAGAFVLVMAARNQCGVLREDPVVAFWIVPGAAIMFTLCLGLLWHIALRLWPLLRANWRLNLVSFGSGFTIGGAWVGLVLSQNRTPYSNLPPKGDILMVGLALSLTIAAVLLFVWSQIVQPIRKALRRPAAPAPRNDPVIRRCPNGHPFALPPGKHGTIVCPVCGRPFAAVT
jgi:hypothetical protein